MRKRFIWIVVFHGFFSPLMLTSIAKIFFSSAWFVRFAYDNIGILDGCQPPLERMKKFDIWVTLLPRSIHQDSQECMSFIPNFMRCFFKEQM